MSTTTSLPLSTVLSVSVVVSPSGSPGPAFNQALILGSSTVIPTSQRLQQFTSLSSIAQAGFSSTSPEYLAASIYFAQSPTPTYLWLGKQDLTAMQTVTVGASGGTGYLVGDILTVVQGGASGGQVQVTSVTSGVVTGITIIAGSQGSGYSIANNLTTSGGNGTGAQVDVTAIGETPVQAITACRLANPQWYACMVVTPVEYGVVETTTGTATINTTALTVASGTGLVIGQLVVGAGVPANTTLASGSGTSWVLSNPVTAALSSTTLNFYTAISDKDYINVAAFIQGCTPPSVFFVNSADAAILTDITVVEVGTATQGSTALTLVSGAGTSNGQNVTGQGIAPGTIISSGGGTTSITLSLPTTLAITNGTITFFGSFFAALQALNYTRTLGIYSTTQGGLYPNNQYFAAAPMGVAMGLNSGTTGSYFTLMFKALTSVTTEPLTQNQVNTIAGTPNRTSLGQSGNVYLSFANGAYAWMENGTMFSSSGSVFFDQVLFLDILASQIQYNGINLLVSIPALPITDAGVAQMATVVSQACSQSQDIGFIAPSGTWQGVTVGPISAGTPLPKGFYVYAPPVSTLTQAQRAARQLPPMNVLIIESEAGQSLVITVNVQP